MLHGGDRRVGRSETGQSINGRGRRLVGSFLVALLASAATGTTWAADCPAEQIAPQIPASGKPFDDPKTPINIHDLKLRLKEYKEGKEGKPGNYEEDVTQVFKRAWTFVEQRVSESRKSVDKDESLAVVLDIDETSLSNWTNLKANDLGFIKGGPCFEEPTLSCGFDEWILKASAPAIPQALTFFRNVIGTKRVAVFFITGRPDSQRKATLANLDSEGFQGFAGLITRRDNAPGTVQDFKSAQRKAIEAGNQYKIIATIGDQQSDLDGGFAECPFKVPNPFYFIR